MRILPALVVFAISIGLSSSAAVQAKLKISIYYETLCPDSIRFIKTQLAPLNAEISDYLELDFVPYGIASTRALPNGTFEFTCQHGEAECYGNKVHSCAISQLTPEVTNAFINCTMSQSNPSEAGQYCSDLLNISYAPIKQCAESTSGTLLLVENGIRTSTLNPSLYWVPWITYNDVFYPEDLDPSQENLLPVVCKHLTGDKPPQCNEEEDDRLKISVYYETLCPDSIRFIKSQLYPVYNEISNYIKLDLVPYGIATTDTLPNGTYTFVCQHGEAECYGNRVHACAISQLQPEISAAFVNCTMSQSDPSQAGQYCSDQLKIHYSPIQTCAESQDGNELLAQNGVRTYNLNPRLYWVPWITYDDEFFPDDLDPSQINLLPVVCKHLRGSKPRECSEVQNNFL